MRIYELVFILRPDLPEEEIEAVIELLKGTIAEAGGSLEKVDKWGKRRLAYRVAKNTEGYYVLLQYTVEENAGLAKELERRLRVSDPVIKYLTVRIDEDLKRLEKLKKKREARTARKPSAPAPAKPSPGAPAAPKAAADKPAAAPQPGEAAAVAAPRSPGAETGNE